MTHECDVVVAGAGPAGAVAALCLARQGLRVSLLHRPRHGSRPLAETLAPQARPLLRALGLFDRFSAQKHLPCYGNCSAWGSPELLSTDFVFHPDGHGWHLDREAFDTMLRDMAIEAGVRFFPAVLVSCASDGVGVSITWKSETQQGRICAPVCIDCTGRASAVARALGARRLVEDKLVACVVATTEAEGTDLDSTVMVEAVRGGWWYSALRPGGGRVTAFFTDADQPEFRIAATLEGWNAMLGKTFHMGALLDQLGGEQKFSPVIVAANSSRLSAFVGSNWIAAGDAAIAFDPVASQGVLCALISGRGAAFAALEALRGNDAQRDTYAQAREAEHANYRSSLRTTYTAERRWPGSAFWQRRK